MTAALTDPLAEAAARLRAAGIEGARREARLLLAHAAGLDPAALSGAARLGAGVPERFAAYVARRAAREPLSRIVGRREFWSLDFALGPECLDPRPDSETLVEAVLRARPERAAPLKILDLGTGTGCLLLALLSEYRHASGLGTDASHAALGVAQANARALGLAGRAGFACADWSAGIAGGFDVALANPPYVASADIERLAPEVARFDPRLALDGGADGLAAYRRIVPELARLLVPGGIAALEIGVGQAPQVAALAQRHGLKVSEIAADLAGIARCILATRP